MAYRHTVTNAMRNVHKYVKGLIAGRQQIDAQIEYLQTNYVIIQKNKYQKKKLGSETCKNILNGTIKPDPQWQYIYHTYSSYTMQNIRQLPTPWQPTTIQQSLSAQSIQSMSFLSFHSYPLQPSPHYHSMAVAYPIRFDP